MREFERIVKERLDPATLARALRADSILPDYMRQKFYGIDLHFAELFERKGGLIDRAYATGLGVENLSNSQWRKLIGKVAIKPDPLKVAEFAEQNVKLIKSVAATYLNETQRLIEEAIIRGERPEHLQEKIAERFSVSMGRAKTIARDQTLKFHGDLVQDKQTSAGVTRYIWTTSNDERVRETHAELEGEEFAWDDPPVTNDQGDANHPGQDYNCRCIAYPVIDFVDEGEWGLSELHSNVEIPRVAA